MSTLTLTGTMTFPAFLGGPDISPVIGSPTANPTSSSVTLTYDEGGLSTYQIAALATQAVSFGSVSDGDFVYIGSDQEITVTMNGGGDTFTISAGGHMMFFKCSCTSASITAGVVDAEVAVIVLGASS